MTCTVASQLSWFDYNSDTAIMKIGSQIPNTPITTAQSAFVTITVKIGSDTVARDSVTFQLLLTDGEVKDTGNQPPSLPNTVPACQMTVGPNNFASDQDFTWYMPFQFYRMTKIIVYRDLKSIYGFTLFFSPPDTFKGWEERE